MKSKEEISETYIKQFESKCGICLRRRSDGVCAYSGYQITGIMSDVREYFELSKPRPSPISCPVFTEVKRRFDEKMCDFDEELRQALVRLALERARREVGPRTLTGKKMIEGR